MSDDLTVIGPDGIRRSYDEHYDTMRDVEQDPTGAHQAIQRQHSRIEELEAKLAKAIGDLGRLSRAEVFGDGGAWGMRLSEDALGREILARMKFARTTLAELTGGKDE